MCALNAEVDLRALLTMTYGLYIVTSHYDGKLNGQLSDAVSQVTDGPPQVAASIHRDGLTYQYIAGSGVYAVCVLEQSAPLELIRLFGFRSGRDVDKLAEVKHEIGVTGAPIVLDHTLSVVEVRVGQQVDVGAHTLFIGEAVHAKTLREGTPLTYAFYRDHLKGGTPRNAPTYRAQLQARAAAKRDAAEEPDRKEAMQMQRYVCEPCGWVYDPKEGDPEGGIEPGTAFEDLPDDWECPLCGAGKDEFSPE